MSETQQDARLSEIIIETVNQPQGENRTTEQKTPTAKKQKTSSNESIVEKLKIFLLKISTLSYYKANWNYFIFILFYILIQIVLIIVQTDIYSEHNDAVIAARSGGILLSLNLSLTVLLILKRVHTRLRNIKLINTLLPMDSFLSIHKFIGIYIIALSLVHTISHCVNLYFKSKEYFNRFEQTNSSNLNSTEEHAAYYELLFSTKSNVGWFFKISCPSGWAILLSMLFIDFLAIPQIRRRKHFEVFINSHRLFIIVYILLIIHCSNFWKWFIGPCVIVLAELFMAFVFVRLDDFGATFIKDVNILPSGVIQLIIMRPKYFNFKAGDYVRIKIPVISKTEYHPFTISSAPENKDEIWLHIRASGDWTNKLYLHFKNFSETNYYVPINNNNNNSFWKNCCSSANQETDVSITGFQDVVLKQVRPRESTVFTLTKPTGRRGSWIDPTKRRHTHAVVPTLSAIQEEGEQTVIEENRVIKTNNNLNNPNNNRRVSIQDIRRKTIVPPEVQTSKVTYNLVESDEITNVFVDIRLDGPFATASRNIFKTKHAIIIGSGIGVTPFASILQSIWLKHSNSIKTCRHCNHEVLHKVEIGNLKKVDFVWINRDYESFEWFMDLLAELELQQDLTEERFLDIHLYSTSKAKDTSIALKSFDKMINKMDNENLKAKAKSMLNNIKNKRPDFTQLLKEITEKSKHNDIEVFFCGNKQISHTLSIECLKLNLKFSQENF